MSASSPFQAVHEAHTPPPPTTNSQPKDKAAEIWDFAEICLQRTAEAMREARVSNSAQLNQAIAIVRESHAACKPADLVEVVTRLQGHAEEHLGPPMLEIANKLASTLSPYAPFIPFAGKLIAPSAFYDSFDQLHRLAKVLLSPVIYVEDTDAIGTASINPVAAAVLAEEIQTVVFKRFGIRPFVTVARLDYESWAFLCRKHFEL